MIRVKVTIERATAPDFMAIASAMREADRNECAALGHSPLQAVERSRALSYETYVGRFDEVPACIFGVGVPLLTGNVARPWMLGTDTIEDHPIVFLRHSRQIVDGWLDRWPVLENWIDERNAVSIAWLRWLGFTIWWARPFGASGVNFHRFEKRRN